MIHKAKVILVGDSAVGKTTLVSRHLKQPFSQQAISTASPVFINSTVNIDGEILNLEIWDTAGQEQYRSLMPMYFRGAQTALLCFTMNTIDSIRDWAKLIMDSEPDCKIVLTLTKSDLISEDVYESIYSKCAETKVNIGAYEFIATSSLENTGVTETFLLAGKASLANKKKQVEKVGQVLIQEKKECC